MLISTFSAMFQPYARATATPASARHEERGAATLIEPRRVKCRSPRAPNPAQTLPRLFAHSPVPISMPPLPAHLYPSIRAAMPIWPIYGHLRASAQRLGVTLRRTRIEWGGFTRLHVPSRPKNGRSMPFP